jgi:uncharacterized protein YndB with AHSA1/START domain
MTDRPNAGDAPDARPIAHEYRLRCGPARAFDAYAAQFGRWWPPAYTANPHTLRSVTIEPRVGGRVFATHEDLGDIEWGRVTAWEPNRRLAYTSTLAQSHEHPNEITVEFTPEGEVGCLVRFSHGGWREGSLADRKKFSDWRAILDRFAALAEGP